MKMFQKIIQIADYISSKLTFKGRLNRRSYFSLILFGIVLSILSSLIILAIENYGPVADTEFEIFIQRTLIFIGLITYIFVWIGFILYFICQSVRRLHDFNFPGWIYFISLILFAGEIGTIIFLLFHLALILIPGTKGPNKYGEYNEYSENSLGESR